MPLPNNNLDCNGAAPLRVLLNTRILKLSRTCPGTFSSGAGT